MRIALILFPFLSLIFSSISVSAKAPLFPDFQLRNAVRKAVGLNSDEAVPLIEEHLLGIEKLNLSRKKIADMTGVGFLKSLKYLDCSQNQIQHLDLRQNDRLSELYCSYNRIDTLILPSTQTLEKIYVHSNNIRRLDLLNFPKLSYLGVSSNPLGKQGVDLSIHPFLIEANFNRCELTALDLSANGRLKRLEVSENQLPNLHLYPTNAIERLICGGNKLNKLNLSRQQQLKELDCRNNQLSELDLSTNTELIKLWCADNQLTRIDLSNNPKLTYIDLRGNPLVEIIVADLDRMPRENFHYDGNPSIHEAPPRKPSTDVSSWKFPVFSETVPTDAYDDMIRGKDINEELAAAVMVNDLRFTAYLLKKGADPNYKADRVSSVLLKALKQKNYEIGELLLHHGAIIDPNTLIQSPLDGVKWLIAHGADVNTRHGMSGDTVLMRASIMGSSFPPDISAVIDRIDLLIAHGAKINATNKDGQNVLHVAAAMGNVKAIRHLLRYDVHATLKNNKGLTALHTLVRRFDIHRTPDWLKDKDASVIEKWENDRLAIIEQVLLQKPDLNARDQDGKTALYYAKGKMAVLLLEHGADPNATIETEHPYYNGGTPLMVAADEADLEWMALLLKYGADPNATDGKGRTALGRIQRKLDNDSGKQIPEVFRQKYILVIKKLIDITGGNIVDRALVRVGADPVKFRLATASVRAFSKKAIFYLFLFGPLLALLAIAAIGMTIKQVRRSQTGSMIIWAGLMSLIPIAFYYAVALSLLGKASWAAGKLIRPIIHYGWIVATCSMVLSSALFFVARYLLQRRRERLSA